MKKTATARRAAAGVLALFVLLGMLVLAPLPAKAAGEDAGDMAAMGADFVMLGRYFSRFDESPTNRLRIGGSYVKEYWGEGSNRARNWQRYDMGGEDGLSFEEGVDSYVPYAGSLKDNVGITLSKVKSTMCNCGALSLPELRERARLTLVSSTSIVEGGSHDVILRDTTKE